MAEDIAATDIAHLKQQIAKLEFGREYKNNLIHTLHHGITALERKVHALEYEKAEKDKTIETLTTHLQLKLEEHKTLVAHQEVLEFKLLNTYGRLGRDVEQYRQCGWGCQKCDEQTLTDLKNLFSCKKDM